jgi:uncharacterized protein (TIGR02145 family)
MNKTFRLIAFIAASIFISGAYSQAPQKMSYQAVIRDNQNHLISNHTVAIKLTILQGSPNGVVVYTETKSPTTNADGLVYIEIGDDAGFLSIDWASGPFFLRTEIDPAGGTNYTISNTSQFLSVPYALYSKSADSYSETDHVFTASALNGITGSNINNWNAAYAWKNHAGLYRSVSWVPAWSDVTGKPSTLEGFGITNGVNTTGDQFIGGTKTLSSTVIANNGIDARNKRINNVADPIGNQDAATKDYVDTLKVRIEKLQMIITGPADKVIDIDSNQYNFIHIGTQVWMAENLKTTRFNDGTVIPLATDNTEWYSINPRYCWYNNDESNKNTYGALYNFFAVNTGKLCPKGWHVFSDEEWTTMRIYLMHYYQIQDPAVFLHVLGKVLASTSGWLFFQSANCIGNTDMPLWRNLTGFTAVPAGGRLDDGTFGGIGREASWWTTTQEITGRPYSHWMYFDLPGEYVHDTSKNMGISVRCIRN